MEKKPSRASSRKKTEKPEKEKAVAIEQFRSNLLSIISHELNTPLTSIFNATSMLEEKFPEEAEFIPMLRRNAERLRKTVENLIEISRVDAGTLRVRLGEVNLEHFLIARKEVLKPILKTQNFDLVLDMEEDLPHICGDTKRLAHVFDALVLNAAKFSHTSLLKPNQQAEVRVKLELKPADDLPPGFFGVKEKKTGLYVQISVESSLPSIGESPSQFEHMFEPFTPWRDADTRMREGLGVELAIAKEILLAHEGFIWADLPGESTHSAMKFSFVLPMLSRLDELDLVINNRLFTLIGALSKLTLMLIRPSVGSALTQEDQPRLAQALKKVFFRASDSIFWIQDSGEFAILMDDCDHEGAERVAQRLFSVLREQMPELEFMWTIATGPDEGANASELLDKCRSSWRPGK